MAYQETDARGRLWQTKLTANDLTPIEGAEKLGAIRELGDGRRFRYIRMTGGNCALGTVLMPATLVTVTDVSAAGTTVGPDGATTTLITDADATWTNDAYINWYFQVATAGTGSQEPIKIVGNTKTTLTLEKSITTTVVAGDDGEILAGTGAGVISSSGDLDIACVGVGIGTITQNYYGWVQVGGPGGILGDSFAEGESICPGGNADGQAIVCDNDADNNVIAVCIAASGDNEVQFVDFRIA